MLLPGATIGILGGGQLGRMTAMAAQSLGYQVQVLDPDPVCAARYVVSRCLSSSLSDEQAAGELARECDVVTFETEQVAIGSLTAAQRFAPVRPQPECLGIIQDRILQKNWLKEHEIPVGDYVPVLSVGDCEGLPARLGKRIYLKSARGGYDGRNQVRLEDARVEALREAWEALGGRACIAERAVAIEMEISVMVARSPRGEVRAYPSARNHHEQQILAWSVIPSGIPEALEAAAQALALRVAEQMGVEGLLAVEMFVAEDGELLVNELAPRPHNSYHASERGCATSQFEQAIRAVCDLPLGDVRVVQPTAIANLLGDLWLEQMPRLDRALEDPVVHLHLYGKAEPRKGRKMGHLSATGATGEEAVERVLRAAARL